MNNFVLVLGMFALINVFAQAMQPVENWNTIAPEVRRLVFEEVMSFFRKEGWETIDDQTAVRLREVGPMLYDEITEHCDQKGAMHNQWIQSIAINNAIKGYSPTLIIERGEPVKAEWLCNSFSFFRDSIKNVSLDASYKCIIEPNSIAIGLSGNTLYGILKSKKDGNSESSTALFGPRVQFKLYANGAICASDMKIVVDPVFSPAIKTGSEMSYLCNSFNNQKSWVVIEIYKDTNEQCRNYRVIIGGARTHSFYFANQGVYKITSWPPEVLFSNGRASQYCHGGGREKAPCYLEYRFEKGGSESECYEHHVEVREGQSISLLRLPETVCQYLLECPIVATKKSAFLVTPQPTCLVHRFIPNDEWPAEIMRYIEHLQRVGCEQGDGENFWNVEKRCLHEYLLLDLARLYQVHALLEFSCGSINNIIVQRSIMHRSATATIYCDVFGRPYSLFDKDMEPKLFDNIYSPSSGVFERWARCLVPIGPLLPYNSGSYHMLYAHNKRHEALKVSASAFLNFFIRQAEQYAEKTWDNGNLGALWQFEPDGMRVRLYNLKAENDNRIGVYLIPNRTEGYVTHVEYVAGQQPLFYIDGEKVTL